MAGDARKKAIIRHPRPGHRFRQQDRPRSSRPGRLSRRGAGRGGGLGLGQIGASAYHHRPQPDAPARSRFSAGPSAMPRAAGCGRWKRWGILFQEGALFSSQSVAENIKVPLREYTAMSEALMDEIAAMKIALVGLPETPGANSLRALRRHEEARRPGPGPGAGSRTAVPRRTDLGTRSDFRQPVRPADRGIAEEPGAHRLHGDA